MEDQANPDIAVDDNDDQNTSNNKRKKVPKIILAVILVAALAGGGYWWWLLSTTVSTDNAKVVVDQVDVSFTAGGKLESVEVKEGDTVQEGQLLAQLENSQQRAAVSQAQANLDLALANEKKLPYDQESLTIAVGKSEAGVATASSGVDAAQAGVENARAGVAKAEAGVSSAEEQLKTAQVNLEDARRNLDINQQLANAGAVSAETLKQAESRYANAEASYNQAEDNLVAAQAGYASAQALVDSAEAGVANASNGVASAQMGLEDSQQKLEASQATAGDILAAQVKVATAALNAAQIALDKTFLKSPMDGIILRQSVLEGENVSAGQMVYTIANLGHTYIQANIEEKYISRIEPGQAVDITIDAYPGEEFTGTVTELWEASQSNFAIISGESSSGNFTKVAQRIPVKIEIDHRGFELKPGMSAEVTIHTP